MRSTPACRSTCTSCSATVCATPSSSSSARAGFPGQAYPDPGGCPVRAGPTPSRGEGRQDGDVPVGVRPLAAEQMPEWHRLPTVALAGLRVPPDLVLRPADPSDFAAIRAAYRTVAQQGNGLLHREGPLFAERGEDLLAAFSGVTLAVDAGSGAVEGYCS